MTYWDGIGWFEDRILMRAEEELDMKLETKIKRGEVDKRRRKQDRELALGERYYIRISEKD